MHRRLAAYAWLVLAYNLGVILWGAYVRASGSGAGCGSHWPLCNGEIVPRGAEGATLIEYSHRLTSGLALVSVVVLLWWTRRACPPPHAARLGAWLSVGFMLTEAAIGAGLVLFELVADNASMARALFMAAHLTNTFILLAWIALTAWWLSGHPRVRLTRPAAGPLAEPARFRLSLGGFGLGLLALLLAGMSGAVAALGDTLFPVHSHVEGVMASLSPTSHVLIRLRILHPAIAVAAGVAVALLAPKLAPADDPMARRLGAIVAALAAVQLGAGVLNVALLAPVWMQLVHLLLADLLWIAFVLLGARALADRTVPLHTRIAAA